MERFDRSYFEKQYGIGKPQGRQSLAKRWVNRIFPSASQEEIILRFLNPLPGEKIIEAGCGLGDFSVHLSNCGSEVTGVDVSDFAIECSRKKEKDNLRFICADVLNVNWSNRFDKAVNKYVLEHLTSEESVSFLSRLHRSLKPGGLIVTAVPLEEKNILRCLLRYIAKGTTIHDPTHIRSISLRGIKNELECAGFKVENICAFSYSTNIRLLYRLLPIIGEKILTNAIIKARKM